MTRAFIVLAALALAACSTAEVLDVPPDPPSHRLVAYVHGGTPGAIGRIGAEKLTHVNVAFANVTPDGEVVLDDPADARRLRAAVGLRERNPDLKVLLSVGGWGWSENFSDAALTAASRERFAESAVALVRAHGLDGLDIDWEYPGQRGEDNVFRDEDRETFTLLLGAVRDALGDGQLLTIAAAAGQTYLDHTDMAAAHRPLDFVNLMTYDFSGSWSARTGHHANLHPSDAVPGAPSTSQAVEQMVAAGVPAEKIVIGAAFYGYRWSGVEASADGLGQPYAGPVTTHSYADLVAKSIGRDGYRRVWDEAAQAPTLWNPGTRTFISYEDEASVARKAEYVRERGLGGLMYWQHLHDPDERLLDAARAVLR
ncbi:glycoside hydrolase family 18 protein [Rubrivirga sp.]|uniref:glycoside hydrolase family 18 protein n=1 Tax=Rubrivirga sp. TaxID=1885344 RepID=UPI003B527EF2